MSSPTIARSGGVPTRRVGISPVRTQAPATGAGVGAGLKFLDPNNRVHIHDISSNVSAAVHRISTKLGYQVDGRQNLAQSANRHQADNDLLKLAGAVTKEQTGTAKIFSVEGTNSNLDLVLSLLDVYGYEVAPVDLSKFKRKEWDIGSDVKGAYWEGPISIPVGAVTSHVVLKVKSSGRTEKEFINEIQIAAPGFQTKIAPNCWIHKKHGSRVFFSSARALLPVDTPEYLQQWRQADLQATQGSIAERATAREDWDRIYDYDIYNDLAPVKEDRPPLGGSEAWPYPRRTRTGQPLVKGPNGQVYEDRANAFWIPLDERFNTRKETNFLSYAVLSAVASLAGLIRTKLLDKDRQITNFNDVDALYAKLADPAITISDNELEDIFDKDPSWTRNPLLSAIKGSISSIKDISGGIKGLLDFPPPAVWQNRTREWTKDEEWGRQTLSGVNPCSIHALTSVSQLGGISEAKIAPHLEGHKLGDLIKQASTSPRLLFIDYTDVFDEFAPLISQLKGKYGYSGRAVLYRRNDDQWVPVGIELKGGQGEVDVYTPADHPNYWLIAKGVFNSLDSTYHQMHVHWMRTHCCTEPYSIATRRNLPPIHPVFQLLVPHFANTLSINSKARNLLVNAGGFVEQIFTPGEYAMRMSSKWYKQQWRFENEALPKDLIARGLATRDSKGSLKLLLKDYPYADDGLLLWNAIEKWVGGYLNLHYDDKKAGRRVTDDPELVAWWTEIITLGHPDQPEGWPELETISDLTEILTTMIWIASGHHAAINFSQYAFNGYAANRPTTVSKPIPARGSKEYQDLIKDQASGEKAFVDVMLGLPTVILGSLLVELLSTHADTEVYMGEPEHGYITDPTALKLYAEFCKDMRALEVTVEQRNRDSSRKMRTGAALPYTYFDPTSKPGIRNRGVPQSISI